MRQKVSLNQKVYEDIKAELKSGHYASGERLEAREIADRYDISTTPVRMALARLAGERLIYTWAFDGFHAPQVTESYLVDLYSTSAATTKAWAGYIRSHGFHNGDLDIDQMQALGPVSGPALLFNTTASATGNSEMLAVSANLNERLHWARVAESHVLTAPLLELRRLAERWQARDLTGFVSLLREYHDRRIDHVRAIVSRMTRKRPTTGDSSTQS